MGAREMFRQHATGWAVLTSVVVGAPSMVGIVDGRRTTSVVNSLTAIVQPVQNPAQLPDIGFSNTSFVNVEGTTENMAKAAQDVDNDSLLHRTAIRDVIEAIRNGDDPATINEKLSDLAGIVYEQMAFAALGFVATGAVVEELTTSH